MCADLQLMRIQLSALKPFRLLCQSLETLTGSFEGCPLLVSCLRQCFQLCIELPLPQLLEEDFVLWLCEDRFCLTLQAGTEILKMVLPHHGYVCQLNFL